MSLTQEDLQAIKGLLQEHKQEVLTEVKKMQADQTKEIAQVINQALSTVDEVYATKSELAEVREKVALLGRQLALS